MSKFIEKYVRLPIEKMDAFARNEDVLLDFYAMCNNGIMEIKLGSYVKNIKRNICPSFS